MNISPPPQLSIFRRPCVDDSELKCNDEQCEGILEHLRSIKPGIIVFTKKGQENILPALNL